MTVTSRRRTAAALLSATLASMVLSACSSDDGEDAAASSSSSDGSYPVTFTSPWGESTVEDKPVRIASLGYKDADVIAALGETPVIMADSTQKQEFYTMDAMPGEPEFTFTYDESDMAPIEEIAAAEPDLIVASQMDLSDNYAKLSDIAPVIAAETTEDISGNWQQTITNLGEALGKQEQAEAVITETADTATRIREEHPEFDGRSITMVNYFGLDQMFHLNPDGTDLATLLSDIGFSGTPGDLPEGAIPEERISDLDADVIVILDNSDGQAADLTENPVFEGLQGNTLVIRNHAFMTPSEAAFDVDGEKHEGNLAWALGYPGPLSTQWELETLAPLLAETVAGE
ncbi:ABC transporter substrate-binding protein [Corynebacterium sp. AOP40-9SA-29]|uniref:ABC transporter substrate-binding protein n=1 Tax=Corynebacterium sp. AOP40-9SA-29 TaxID=3457677 RepID=UPI0040348FF1